MGNTRRRIGAVLLLFAASFVTPAIAGEGQEVRLRVDGLACPFCAYGLEKKLKRIEGVEKFDLDLDTGEVTLIYGADARVDEDLLRQKVKEAGFTPRGIEVIGSSEDTADQGDAVARDATAEFNVEGMRCEYCSANISSRLRAVDGVSSTEVDFASKTVVVTYDPSQTGPEQLIETIESAGDFRASVKR